MNKTATTLEEAIRQPRFHSEHHKLTVNLLYTSHAVTAWQAHMMKPYGLTPPQYNVLRILRGGHPAAVSLQTITERMLDPMSNAGRIVEKLLEKNLATRRTCPHDRRAAEVGITPEGLSLLARLDTEQAAFEARMLEGLTPDDAACLNTLLDRFRAALNA